MIKVFIKYVVVGGFNTLLHWATFALVYNLIVRNQMISNFVAFCIAVTFSFYVNARWTFKAEHTSMRYFMFVGFMGLVALCFGLLADELKLNPYITLIGFSGTSLLIGFLYSNFIVFRKKA